MDLWLFSNQPNHAVVQDTLEGLRSTPMFKDCRAGKATVRFHGDREPFVEILENVRGRKCVVIACTTTDAEGSVNDHAMMTLVLLDALHRNGAKIDEIVFPYFPYARQDRRKGESTDRTAITAKLFAKMLQMTVPELKNLATVEPHTVYLEGFFDCTFDRIKVLKVFVEDVRSVYPDQDRVVVASPDVGGRDRASAFATELGAHRPIAYVDKRRPGPGLAKATQLIGNVQGADVVIVDDILDSAGSIQECVRIIREHGAERILVVAVHGLNNGPAIERLLACELTGVMYSNSVTQRPEVEKLPGHRILHIGGYVAAAIHCLITQGSLRNLGKPDSSAR